MVIKEYQHIKPSQFIESESDKQFRYGFYWGWLLAIGIITLFIAII